MVMFVVLLFEDDEDDDEVMLVLSAYNAVDGGDASVS